MSRRTLLSWSSGKDSAWALHVLRQQPDVELVGLVTSVNEAFARVAMHAVRETLLERQAAAAALPLWKVPIPNPCPDAVYQAAMAGVVKRAEDAGVECMAFGDLFLEEIRAYRVEMLAGTGLEAVFPIWGRPTGPLAREMLQAGLRAFVTCVDPRQLDPAFAGRRFDADFLADLPEGVDPCGENGEFHTFAYQGPMFREPLDVTPGEVVERDGFVFADLS